MDSRKRLRVGFALLLALGAPGSASWAAEAARHAALLSITTEEVKDHVGVLADDTFEGRASGSRGNRAAGIYIIEHLKKLGVRGGGLKQSFYQAFDNYHNILGLVEGRDPQLKDQVIVISAHYDHVGYGTPRTSLGPIGLIHNGADDNASGVAGLLEVAGAVNQLPEKPRRSILFAFWDGEEIGLVGSQHWVGHPTVPLAQVPIMINVDMIGRLRNSKLEIFGTRTSSGLRRLVSQQNDVSGLLLDFNWDIKADSDHYSFYSRDIPFLLLFTGMHDDYHRPSDDVEKINNEGLKQISQLVFNVLVELADAPSLSGFRRQARQESHVDDQAKARALPPPAGRLGIRWDEKAAQDGTIAVAVVTRGSAAEKAGLRVGDRLLKFAGREISDMRDFRRRVLAVKSPVAVTIERPGEPSVRELSIELPGEPVRLGISWRTDDAEPGVLIINRMTSGSPADLAGLRVNDRIYRLGGHDFATAEEFRQLVNQTAGPIVLEVETAGRVRTVEISPIDPESEVAEPGDSDEPQLAPAS